MANEKIVPPGLYKDVERFIALLKHVSTLPSGKKHILISGDTGVGKSLFTELSEKVLEYQPDKVVRVNIAALHFDNIESELFGHVKGAYTGAIGKRDGFLKKANDGLLIVEEIGELPPQVQAKFLTFIEDGYYYPMGSEVEIKPKVQIVATTNQPKSAFREDFWQRFIRFYVPPLYMRRQDVLYYLFSKYPDLVKSLRKWEVLALLAHNWPGNVREIDQLGMQVGWTEQLPKSKSFGIEDMIARRGKNGRLLKSKMELSKMKQGPRPSFSRHWKGLQALYELGRQQQDFYPDAAGHVADLLENNNINAGYLDSLLSNKRVSIRSTESFANGTEDNPAFTDIVLEEIEYVQELFDKYSIKYCHKIKAFCEAYEGLEWFCALLLQNSDEDIDLLDLEANKPHIYHMPLSAVRKNRTKELIKLEKDLFEFRTGRKLPSDLPSLPSDPDDIVSFYTWFLKDENEDESNLDITSMTENELLTHYYAKMLEKYRGNITKTAESLGLNRNTFSSKLNKYPELKKYAEELRR